MGMTVPITLNIIEDLTSEGLTPFKIVDSLGFDRDGNPGLVEQNENNQYVNRIVPPTRFEKLQTSIRLTKEMTTLLKYAIDNEVVHIEEQWVGNQSRGQLREVYVYTQYYENKI